MKYKAPKIFNTDQGCQFTSEVFTNKLLVNNIALSMDGKGRAFDNIFIERLWRTVKYEEVYLKDYSSILEAKMNLTAYFNFYNYERHHQSLNYNKPAKVYFNRSFPVDYLNCLEGNLPNKQLIENNSRGPTGATITNNVN